MLTEKKQERKMVRWRFIAVVVFVVIASLLLGGCGGTVTVTETKTAPPVTVTATPSAATITTATTAPPATITTPPVTVTDINTPPPVTITETVTMAPETVTVAAGATTPAPETETTSPTTTAATTTPPLHTVSLTDPTGDLFDKNGVATNGESYLDITSIEVSLYDTYYLATMKLNGNIPSATPDPTYFIEWDILVDSDLNNTTGWSDFSLICNDIGPDLMFRLELMGEDFHGTVYFTDSGIYQETECTMSGDTIQWRVAKTAGYPDVFRFVAAVREYGNSGDPNYLLVADKTPNTGHAEFPIN